jgi:hypothetical protein
MDELSIVEERIQDKIAETKLTLLTRCSQGTEVRMFVYRYCNGEGCLIID